MPDAVIHAHWANTITRLAPQLADLLPETAGTLPVIPSPIRTDVAEVSELRVAWRKLGHRTSLRIPRPIASAVIRRRDSSHWNTIDVRGMQFRVDSRLTAEPYIAVLSITDELRQGPFILELPTHFLHPADRIRLAMLPDKVRLQADVFAFAPPEIAFMITPVADGWLAVASTDPIAAELWSLGLAERWLGTDLEMQGPWEDHTLQRATQLELGIRIPAEMTFATGTLDTLPAEARDLLLDTATRLGMPVSPQRR